MKRIIKNFILLSLLSLISTSSLASKNSSEKIEFNKKKLGIVCDYFSNDKTECKKESIFLINKNTENSVVNYCFRNYQTIEHLSNCLNYEYNPLIFLKYKSERPITEMKEFSFKMTNMNCRENNDCFYELYEILEKAKTPNNWIENHCLNTNIEINDAKKCINKIKVSGKNNNDLLYMIPNLSEALQNALIKDKNKKKTYFKEVEKVCSEKYVSNQNIMNCIESVFKPIKREMITTELKTMTCLESKNTLEFKECLNK